MDISKALGQSNLGLPADGIEKNDINLVDRRDRIVKLMLTVANQNSETYLNRFFSSDLTLPGVQKITNRSLTVFQTATTTASPEIPAIIGISNLVVDGIMEDYQSLILADKTFQAMAKLIRVERDELDQEIRQKLLDNTSYSQYTLQDAIKDIAILSQMSSIQYGIKFLEEVAEEKVQLTLADNKLIDTKSAEIDYPIQKNRSGYSQYRSYSRTKKC